MSTVSPLPMKASVIASVSAPVSPRKITAMQKAAIW